MSELDPTAVLDAACDVLVVDYPSRELPEALVRAGHTVTVKAGPDPDDYAVYEVVDDVLVVREVRVAPAHADLVYMHRSLEELSMMLELAAQVGAPVVWFQSGRTEAGEPDPRVCWCAPAALVAARELAGSHGIAFLSSPYLVDALSPR